MKIKKDTLKTELEARGFRLPTATTYHTKLRGWLAKAGVIGARNDWTIDEETTSRLAGIDQGVRGEWAALTKEQRALLITLKRMSEGQGLQPHKASDVLSAAKYEHGSIFREDQLAARVYKPLEAGGWISRQVSKGGRGGKSGMLVGTEKLLDLNIDLLPQGDEWGVPDDLRPLMDTPLDEIVSGLKANSTHDKGMALELLALRIATDATLIPLRFRLLANETGGAEVDLVAEGVHLHFSRWLFQCKNTKTVALADLAKEIGMAVMLRAHVAVMVTTGRFASSVETYARELMDTHPLQVILIDGQLIEIYKDRGLGHLLEFLKGQAEATMRVKRGQVERSVVQTDE